MPRKPVPIVAQSPYHISARCINREWFHLSMPTMWSLMSDYLYLTALGFNLRIHTFVLMSNHFHLIVTPTDGNLSEALLYFMRETSREVTRLSGRINQTYGMRNHKTLIGNFHYFTNTYKYIYRNPVRAKICQRVEEYPYSTIRGLLGLSQLTIPLDEDTLLFGGAGDTLAWLNQSSEPAAEEHMRLALRRAVFQFKPEKNVQRPLRWETERI